MAGPIRHRIELLQLALEVGGESEEAAAVQGHEPTVRLVEPREHVLHVDDDILIHGDPAADLEPVALARNFERQVLGAHRRAHLDRLAVGPFKSDRQRGSLHFLKEAQRGLEIVDPPLACPRSTAGAWGRPQ